MTAVTANPVCPGGVRWTVACGCLATPCGSTQPPPAVTGGGWVTTSVGYTAKIGGAFTAAAQTAAAATGSAATLDLDLADGGLAFDLTHQTRNSLVPGSVRFDFGAKAYEDRGTGILYTDVDPVTGSGLVAGSIDYGAGEADLTLWSAGATAASLAVTSGLARYGDWGAIAANFRTELSPLKPEALSISVTTEDGVQLTASADADGLLSGVGVEGRVDYEFGTASLFFGAYDDDPEYTGEPPTPQVWVPRVVDPSTLRYNAVAYSYLPLDADILGIDPVRLPSDGRVPIYRPGDISLVMHVADATPATIADGGVLNAGRTRLAWARVIDANGATVSGDLYTLDRAAGTVTVPDVTDLDQPLTLRHTVADLRMITDAQISGWLTLSRALSHDYPAEESIVAGCLLIGDRRARVSGSWDQATWTGVWQDSIIGTEATATLNLIDFPIEVTNEGCDTDRWLLRCTNASGNAWELISEKRGLVWSGTYAPYVSGTPADVAPINPRTRTLLEDGFTYVGGVPYLTIPQRANGGGWSTGNAVRINTVGAIADFWIARSIQQSDEPADPAAADGCEIYALGNVDRP